MEKLSELIKQQKRDQNTFRIYEGRVKNKLVRPHVFRFPNFAGDTTKQRAFCVLKYFGWDNEKIIEALGLTVFELASMQSLLGTTVKRKLHKRFYDKIPADTPRNKAVLILRGLKWKEQDLADLFNISRRQIGRITKIIRENMAQARGF